MVDSRNKEASKTPKQGKSRRKRDASSHPPHGGHSMYVNLVDKIITANSDYSCQKIISRGLRYHRLINPQRIIDNANTLNGQLYFGKHNKIGYKSANLNSEQRENIKKALEIVTAYSYIH